MSVAAVLGLALSLSACDKKLPAALEDVAAVVAGGKIQHKTDTSVGVGHTTAAGPSAVFAQYAAALEAKGWLRTRENAKPHTEPPAHNGCFARAGKELSVSASRQGERAVGVVVAVGCGGIL